MGKCNIKKITIMFENRRWLVIPISLTGSINFDQVLESNVDSLRLSVDGSQTFIKYQINEFLEDETQTFIDPETGNEVTTVIEKGVYGRPSIYSEEYVEYNHQGILELLSTEVWSLPMQEI